jgi:CRP/FNR family transcriptional regulator
MSHITIDLEPALLQEIAAAARQHDFAAGDVVLQTGSIVRMAPLLLSGLLKVIRVDEQGNELFLYYIKEQESCAMTFTCCMQQLPSEIRITAEEDSCVLLIPIDRMDQWMMKFPSWKTFVMKTIRSRFQELLRTIDQIAFQKLDERLLHYLRLKAASGSLILLSHQQIADDLATSRVVISRLLKKMENDGLILLNRHQIKVLRPL